MHHGTEVVRRLTCSYTKLKLVDGIYEVILYNCALTGIVREEERAGPECVKNGAA